MPLGFEQRKRKWVSMALAKANVVHEWLDGNSFRSFALRGAVWFARKSHVQSMHFEVL